jgi:hypothetical protein
LQSSLGALPYDPTHWQTDGRLYPPLPDSRRSVADHPEISRYRSRGHNTFIAKNGAIEIVSILGEVVLRKPGADGRHVWGIGKPLKS